MLFDTALLFYHTGTAYAFTSGEYVSLVGIGTASASASTAINLGVAEDMGIGDGPYVPKIAVLVGTSFTSSCTSLRLNAQFQGSTNNSTWSTYAETGPLATSSFSAGYFVLPIDVPRVPSGLALPQYYQMNFVGTGALGVETLSAGTVIGGIVIQRQDNAALSQYPAGFSA